MPPKLDIVRIKIKNRYNIGKKELVLLMGTKYYLAEVNRRTRVFRYHKNLYRHNLKEEKRGLRQHFINGYNNVLCREKNYVSFLITGSVPATIEDVLNSESGYPAFLKEMLIYCLGDIV